MGSAFPFSQIDKYLSGLETPVPGCLVDTHFLIAATEELHSFYDDAKFLFDKLAQYKIPIFTTVTTRAEFIDIRRRSIMTEVLMDMLAPSSEWKISAEIRRVLRNQKTWIDTQAKDDQLPILTDKRIKDCKECFLPRNQSGQVGWIALCREYLYGRLLESWNSVVEELGLNYIDMRHENIPELFPEKVSWERMYSISEETCLASNDAMLVNALRCSSFPFIASADFDLAYSILSDRQSEKTVLVPDSLHYSKIKQLRF